ncbi:hypothetical protein MB46_18075 [Arthrobacter alpinus]|uniref:helix-turn-helix domain-containing protein n=1 Tax=Arthrobacter alpinus TaxID=656366 RepID=UPI0005CB74F9|nr:AraC family transcriptional regulator [Arthrobacter alpinus]ALV47111.1 hypothetical protein MB46_18075 [Arthrobacter alpinus]
MYQQISSSIPAVNCLWRAVVDEPATYIDPANEYWGLAFTRRSDRSFRAELIGPSLDPRELESRRGDAYWGVEFRAHVVIEGATKSSVLGATVDLGVDGNHFELLGCRYRVPHYEELEPFVAGLLDSSAITSREDVRRSLTGDGSGYSPRSWQRHIRWVTGLSRKQIQQLERARHAFFLLQNGYSPSDAAVAAGYADQAHMTRSMRLLRSETPAQIIAHHRAI